MAKSALIAAISTALCAAIYAGSPQTAQKPPAGNPVNGKKIFASATPPCTLCHKVGGSGGVLGPDLSAIGKKHDAVWFLKYLPNPQAFDPKNKMPPVTVKGQDLTDLVAYLVTLKGK